VPAIPGDAANVHLALDDVDIGHRLEQRRADLLAGHDFSALAPSVTSGNIPDLAIVWPVKLISLS
jgi:hypothetical protein